MQGNLKDSVMIGIASNYIDNIVNLEKSYVSFFFI